MSKTLSQLDQCRGKLMRMPRFVKRAVVAATATGGMVVFASTPALASADLTVHVHDCGVCSTHGYGWFKADPEAGLPGDALKACDLDADTYAITAWLYNRDTGNLIRKVSTAGHAANYCTPWATGNIAEQTPVWLKVCTTKGSTEYLCNSDNGWA
ncbi:hypothetical protein [Streptomyces sp. IBSBF 2806]|uniref:hypothetical protein n=1 Tax=Streptomyces sp. IBSBF 2806 TaxID=2903529 RepID=UPI002FDBC22B